MTKIKSIYRRITRLYHARVDRLFPVALIALCVNLTALRSTAFAEGFNSTVGAR